MARARKKPVVIDFYRWPGGEMIPPAPHYLLRERRRFWMFGERRWQLKTLEGWYWLTPGDVLIVGVKKEWYPCKPDIFSLTYDVLEEDPI